MVNSISGKITYKDDTRVFLQTGPVELDIQISRNTSDDLPEPGSSVRIFVYLYHRDDQLKLFGFSEAAERDIFLDLLKVEGVGPRQAVKILSGIEVQRFIAALENEDLVLLSSIPGLGKKTAQKIILKLKGRLTLAAPSGISIEEDLTAALVGMGFDRRSAKTAVNGAVRSLRDNEMSGEELERELFKIALAELSGAQGGGTSFRRATRQTHRDSGGETGA